LPVPPITVVIPTLASDPCLLDCLASLERQRLQTFRTVVVDNSGRGAIHGLGAARFPFVLVENPANLGFGEAVNRGFASSPADYLAVLNDDACADPGWLEALHRAMESEPSAGMAACRILQKGTEMLDSAGLGLALDGSSKQIGRGEPAGRYAEAGESLAPSGCAAIYRRAMFEELGGFDTSFFLYCEDTDLALRGHWAGWRCLYVPEAVVEHRYSVSSGQASPLKGYLVERNRLRLAVRCLPWSWLVRAPFASMIRYFHHLGMLTAGKGKAGAFVRQNPAWLLPWLVVKAHLALLRDLPRLLRERRRIPHRIPSREFAARLRGHRIPLREVAAQ
jgi:GT2 family glycosyltransferase